MTQNENKPAAAPIDDPTTGAPRAICNADTKRDPELRAWVNAPLVAAAAEREGMQDAFERSEFYFNGESPAERSHNWKVWVAAWKAARRPVRTFVKDIITGVAAQYRDQGMKRIAGEILSLIDAEHAAPVPAPSPADERATYGSTDFGYTFVGIDLEEGDKRLMALLVRALGTDHPAIEDMTALLFRARGSSANETGAEGASIDIVFDGPPSRESGRFVEVEDEHGRSFNAGEWIDRGNGLWALRIARSPAMAAEAVGRFDKALNQIRWRDGLVNADFRDGQPFYAQPAQADARVGLTDEQRMTIQHAADKLRTVWANHTGDKESRELCHKLEALLQGANQ